MISMMMGCAKKYVHQFKCKLKYKEPNKLLTKNFRCSYNPTKDKWEPNPDGKYIYGMTCVSKCPPPYKNDNGTCVRTCPPTKISSNGECVACSGFCPKICIGHGTVNAQNIYKYKGCNIITGSLGISNSTFEGYYKIHPDELYTFLSLKEVTDNIQIDGYHEHFTNLSYFANLSVIGGSLYIEKVICYFDLIVRIQEKTIFSFSLFLVITQVFGTQIFVRILRYRFYNRQRAFMLC
jgi:hypothetical protein